MKIDVEKAPAGKENKTNFRKFRKWYTYLC